MLQEVLAAARSILGRLSASENSTPPEDVLPGIKPAKQIADLAAAIDTCGETDSGQGKKQKEAEGALEEIKADVATAGGPAAAGATGGGPQGWPRRKPGVATIRKEFLLPVDRPLPE